MCTAITYKTHDFYFGRTLDYEMMFGETVTLSPRSFPFHFRHAKTQYRHYAILGMAHVAEDYPLYYDAINEKGLGMAGLNFVGNAHYGVFNDGKDNIASFELIPWLLGRCATTRGVLTALSSLNIVNTPFSSQYPVAQLHWLIADKDRAITLESVADGLKIHENSVGILTNNPPFDEQLRLWDTYSHLTAKEPPYTGDPRFFSRGRGALGLPGDLSSSSRFARAVFTKRQSVSGVGETESVSQFFHILGMVEQVRGCCELENGEYEITQYTSCCNATKGIYYYTTYENQSVTAVDMHRENLESDCLVSYPLKDKERIYRQN